MQLPYHLYNYVDGEMLAVTIDSNVSEWPYNYGFVVYQFVLAQQGKNSNHQHFAVNTGSMGVACPLLVYMPLAVFNFTEQYLYLTPKVVPKAIYGDELV